MSKMTAADVSRLLGRVAFGATPADLDAWTGRNYEDLVETVVAGSTHPVPAPLPDDAIRVKLELDPQTTHDARAARNWWIERMRTTPYPLLERMTLLWHGHFATAVSVPPFVCNLVRQNQTMRRNALGSFRTMVAELTVDPAMLFWLNGYQNAIPHPNENYGREFFELFTLGKRPQVYGERDIREAARSFTGWYVDSNNEPKFDLARHDKGTKKILGRVVKNGGEKEYLELVDIALDHPASYGFIAWKLVANLGYLHDTRHTLKTNDVLIRKVTKALRTSDWNLSAGVRALLLADEFRNAPAAQGKQYVRQPVECAVHATKALGVRAAEPSVMSAIEGMGQSLFNPVNVGGWPLGGEWISPVTAIHRYELGLSVSRIALGEPAVAATLPAPDDLAGWAKRLGVGGFGTNTTNAVKAYLRRAATAAPADKQTGVLTLLLSSPEWAVM